MMHTAWNLDRRASGGSVHRANQALARPWLPSRWVSLFPVLILLASPAALAAEDSSGPFLFASSTRTLKDIGIEAKIRRTWQQDAQLRPLNLGVHVSGGIAQLSGPVPTAELKQRAMAIAQQIDGVLSVSGKDLYISTSDSGGKRLSVFIQDDRPTQTRSASPSSPIGGTGQKITLLAPEMTAPAPPLPLSPPAAPEEKPRAARLTVHPHPPSPTVSIAAALEQLRRRETRYQQIQVQVQGATVYIFPSGAASDDVMAFAQAIRRLPGVQHVILASDPH